MQCALSPCTRLEVQLPRADALEGRGPHALLKRHVDVVQDRAILTVDTLPSLLHRNPRLEPAEQVRPVVAAVLEPFPARHNLFTKKNRDVYERADSEGGSVKTFRRYSDNR